MDRRGGEASKTPQGPCERKPDWSLEGPGDLQSCGLGKGIMTQEGGRTCSYLAGGMR